VEVEVAEAEVVVVVVEGAIWLELICCHSSTSTENSQGVPKKMISY
jgi:hypothetical protein